MSKLKDIKIRNVWSNGRDLEIVYKEGEERKHTFLKNFPWYFVVNDKGEDTFWMNRFADKIVKEDGYIKLYFLGTGGKEDNRASKAIETCKEDGYTIYESDVHSAKRFMTDYPVEVSADYDILYWDIETDDTKRFISIGQDRILSIAAIDNTGKEFYFTGDEKKILKDFLKLIENYDILTGWNTNDFDLPYLRGKWDVKRDIKTKKVISKNWINGRMNEYKLKFDWYKIANIDLMMRMRKLFKEDSSLKSYSLENVSQHFLGKGKVKYEGKIIDMYNNDPKKFKEYNLQDVKLLKELDEKIGIISLIAKECALSKTLISQFQGLYVSEVLDNMILRVAHEQHIYCPSKKIAEHTDYAGGLVFEPKPGLYKNVYVFDFKSLYPSIILTSNIGFDTIDKHDGFITEDFHYKVEGLVENPKMTNDDFIENPGTKVKFLKHKQSIVAQVVGKLVDERQVYKKKRLELVAQGKMKSSEYEQARANEIIIKELSNSVYGIMGLQSGRYYSLEIAESITKFGHWLLNFSKSFFYLEDGMNVIYGDTDSIFVESDHKIDIDEVLKRYHWRLEDVLKHSYNIDKSWIYLKYEKLFDSLLMVGKKYYAGNVSNIEGENVKEFIVKGLDLVKKATIPIALESQQEILNLILSGKKIEELEEAMTNYKYRILNNNFTFDELKIVTGITRNVNEYKQINAPHVRMAKEMIKLHGQLESNDIEYVIVDDCEPSAKLASRETFTGVFDNTYYWNNKVLPGLTRVLHVAFQNVDWNSKYYIRKRKVEPKYNKNQLTLF